MRKMKDSGIEWIGEIPESWNIGRIGRLYTERKTKVSDVDYPPLSVTKMGILPQLSTAAKTDAHDDRKLVCKGDFAINSRSDRRGSCGISPYDGSVSLINTILCPRDEMHPVYYDWLFHSSMFSDEFYKWGHGIVDDLWTTNWQDMKKISVPMPPLSEQARIATYLDTKCAKIDAVLEQTRNSIEEYKKLKQSVITQAVTKGIRPGRKLKDSGIDFIGMIPEAWDFSRMKNVASIVDCKNRTPDNIPEGEYTVVRTACIRNGKFTYEGSYKTDESNYRAWTERGAPHKGDVFFTREAPVGEACMVPDDPSLCMGQRVMYFRPFDGIDGRFLMYSVYGSLAQEYIITKNNGSTVGHLKLGQVGELPLLLCSYEEQQQICDYLDVRTKRIEIIIAKKEQFLTALESYKKSLIYECVTGKREVISNSQEAILISGIDLKAIVAMRIIELMGNDLKGRVHLQKALYLFECMTGLCFNSVYVREKHGPMDRELTLIENLMQQKRWCKVIPRSPYQYVRLKGFETYRRQYEKHFSVHDQTLIQIVEFIRKMKTSQAERVATLMAAWNDFLIEGKSNPSDHEIIEEIRTNWHERKAHTPESTWQGTLDKMKRNGIVPHGYGKHTIMP